MSTGTSLSTTSYAILGLLRVKSMTTYEIARQMDRALGQFWPRARSKIYEEPKKLVALGLATATRDLHGKRPRTVYSITPSGGRRLRAWLAAPSAAPTVEFEHLIKVFFCEHASKDALIATLSSAREWSRQQTVATSQPAVDYLEGEAPFPERLPWLILVSKFLDEFLVLIEQWATEALEEVAGWPDDLIGAPPDLAALRRQLQRARDVESEFRR